MDIFDTIIVILQLIAVSVCLFTVYIYFKTEVMTFKKFIILFLLFLFFLWNLFLLWLFSYMRLQSDLSTIYKTGKAQYGCGVFVSHSTATYKGPPAKAVQYYKINGKPIAGSCYMAFPACNIQEQLVENEEVCISYAQSKYASNYNRGNNIYHIYTIERKGEKKP